MPVQSEKHRVFSASHTSRPRHAILLAVRRSGQDDELLHWSVSELETLSRELGVQIVFTMVQTRSHADTAPILGSGKLASLAQLFGEQSDTGVQPDMLLVNATLTPHQHQALVTALQVEVVDRTQLILQLFAVRARTKVAQLTIALAQQQHMLPRLRDDTSKQGREGGGGRGERGNTQVALAKQRARARIATLERDLASAQRSSAAQRARREGLRRVALIGYTNVGKSSWLSALTGKATLIADKPFATLDTTVRTLARKSAHPEPILVSDTVGFLRDLPHTLVPSFQATLQEASEADLCLWVADANDPHLQEQLALTDRTLHEIGAGDVPRVVLLNKADRLDARAREALQTALPNALLVSAHRPEDVSRVRRLITDHFELPE